MRESLTVDRVRERREELMEGRAKYTELQKEIGAQKGEAGSRTAASWSATAKTWKRA